MKKIAIPIGISALVLSTLLSFWSCKSSAKPASAAAMSDVYLGLRNHALSAQRDKIGLPTPSDSTQPWGVIMDWGISSGTATVVAFSDGGASVYLSSGGGFLGGQSKPAINRAAKLTVGLAGEMQPKMSLTTSFPVAQKGQVFFYVLTDSGVFTASATDEELSSNRHPFSKLGNAAQEIITQYRLEPGKQAVEPPIVDVKSP